MKLAIIGHLCLDVIHHIDSTTSEGYGGIFFSIATAANLLGPKDVVMPVLGVGKNDYDAFIDRLQRYPNVSTDGIYKFTDPTNSVHLYYKDNAERMECSKFISEPIPFKKISPHLDADMILVNMISGFDITLETLDEIRMDVRDQHTPVYLDVHSLTLGIREDFTRFHRPVELWRRWLFMLHGAQMNEEEAAILAPEKLNEMTLANHTLAMNTKVLNITRGKRGCTSFIDNHKHLQRIDISGIPLKKEAEPTGCGDVFAAAYCSRYMKAHDVAGAVEFANRVAAAKAETTGSDAIDILSAFRTVDSLTVNAV